MFFLIILLNVLLLNFNISIAMGENNKDNAHLNEEIQKRKLEAKQRLNKFIDELKKSDETININFDEICKKENLDRYFPESIPYELQKLIAQYAYTEQWELKKIFLCGRHISRVISSPNGRYLSVYQSPDLKIYDTKDYSLSKHFDVGGFNDIDFIGYSPNNKYLIALDKNSLDYPSIIIIWDALNDYRLLYNLKLDNLNEWILQILYSPNSKYLACLIHEKTKLAKSEKIKILDVDNDYKCVYTIDTLQRQGSIKSISYAPDGSKIAASLKTGNILVWGLNDPNAKLDANEEKNTYYNKLLGLFRYIYDTSINKLLHTKNFNYKLLDSFKIDHKDAILKYSPNNKYIASVSHYKIKIWDAITYELLHCIDNETELINMIFSTNGKYLATRFGDCIIKIWNSYTFKLIQIIKSEYPISDFSFSLDNSLVALVKKFEPAKNGYEAIHIWKYKIE